MTENELERMYFGLLDLLKKVNDNPNFNDDFKNKILDELVIIMNQIRDTRQKVINYNNQRFL